MPLWRAGKNAGHNDYARLCTPKPSVREVYLGHVSRVEARVVVHDVEAGLRRVLALVRALGRVNRASFLFFVARARLIFFFVDFVAFFFFSPI